MGSAYKCTRCDDLFEGEPAASYLRMDTPGHDGWTFCGQCHASVRGVVDAG